MARNEEGFTLIELLVVVTIIGVLSAAALGFHASARQRTADIAAKANIDAAIPAMNAYYQDEGTFTGMTQAELQSSYSPGIRNITVVSAGSAAYCVSSTVDGSTWYKLGPSGPLTTTRCP